MKLRDYQEEALQAILDAEDRGIDRQLVVLPTGAGKTIIFSHLPQVRENSLPMLVLAHREELLNQAKEKIEHANPGLRVDIEQADRYADRSADVVVASVATIGRKDSGRIREFDPGYFKTIVVDEAHHAAAPTYRNVLDYFEAPLRLGVTATPQRGDNVRLTDVFDEVVYYKSILDLIDGGYLSRLVGYRVKTSTDISGVKTRNGDYADSDLSEAINTPERNALIVESYKKLLEGRQTLVFCADVAHGEAVLQAFLDAGIPTAAVFGHTPTDTRQTILHEFAVGAIQVLVNVGVLTEGFDEPSVCGIILARPTRSPLLYTQIVGRGTRLYGGKGDCAIVDLADISRSKKPLGLPTLLGLPPDLDLEGEDLVETAKRFMELEAKSPSEAARVRSLEDLELAWKRIDLFMPPPASPTVQDYSRLVWAEIGEENFYLNVSGRERIHIYRGTLGDYSCSLIVSGNDGSRQAVEPLGDRESLREAFSLCDKWVQNSRPECMALLDANAYWRSDPPTDKQLKVLRKYGIPLTEDLTKGLASQIIDKLFAENPKKPKPPWLQKKIAAQKKW